MKVENVYLMELDASTKADIMLYLSLPSQEVF